VHNLFTAACAAADRLGTAQSQLGRLHEALCQLVARLTK